MSKLIETLHREQRALFRPARGAPSRIRPPHFLLPGSARKDAARRHSGPEHFSGTGPTDRASAGRGEVGGPACAMPRLDARAQRAYARLIDHIAAALDLAQPQCIAITSTTQDQTSATAVMHLAHTAASQFEKRTLLIEADFAAPQVAELLGLAGKQGLSDVLAHGAFPADAIHQCAAIACDIMPSGRAGHRDLELPGSRRMQVLLRELKRSYELILVHSSPIRDRASAERLSVGYDAVFLTVQMLRTTRQSVQVLLDQVRGAGVQIQGCILTHDGSIHEELPEPAVSRGQPVADSDYRESDVFPEPPHATASDISAWLAGPADQRPAVMPSTSCHTFKATWEVASAAPDPVMAVTSDQPGIEEHAESAEASVELSGAELGPEAAANCTRSDESQDGSTGVAFDLAGYAADCSAPCLDSVDVAAIEPEVSETRVVSGDMEAVAFDSEAGAGPLLAETAPSLDDDEPGGVSDAAMLEKLESIEPFQQDADGQKLAATESMPPSAETRAAASSTIAGDTSERDGSRQFTDTSVSPPSGEPLAGFYFQRRHHEVAAGSLARTASPPGDSRDPWALNALAACGILLCLASLVYVAGDLLLWF